MSSAGRRYIIIGGSVYLFELLVIALAQQAGASAPLAVAISFVSGTIVSFVLQKFITFRDTRTQRRVVLKQVLATGLLIIWNLAFSVGLTKLLEHHAPAVVVRTAALAITTIWNFYLYKTRIFNSELVGIVD